MNQSTSPHTHTHTNNEAKKNSAREGKRKKITRKHTEKQPNGNSKFFPISNYFKGS